MLSDSLSLSVKVDHWKCCISRGKVCAHRKCGIVSAEIGSLRTVGYWHVEVTRVTNVLLLIEKCEGDRWLKTKWNVEGGVRGGNRGPVWIVGADTEAGSAGLQSDGEGGGKQDETGESKTRWEMVTATWEKRTLYTVACKDWSRSEAKSGRVDRKGNG